MIMSESKRKRKVSNLLEICCKNDQRISIHSEKVKKFASACVCDWSDYTVEEVTEYLEEKYAHRDSFSSDTSEEPFI